MDTSFVVILLVVAVASNTDAATWSYGGTDGPATWAGNYESCGGSSQSPIDIVTSSVNETDLGEFTLVGFGDVDDKNMTLVNNGHSLQVNLVGDYSVTGGGLSGKYLTDQFHFHWGSNDQQGSEHAIDGGKYPVEMHMVHHSDIFATLTESLSDPTGAAVLGFLFEVSAEDNPAFDVLLNAVANVTNKDDQYQFPTGFTLSSLLPKDLTEFYRYQGSLTTPECNEAVVWTMFKQRISLSSRQIAVLRTLQDNGEAIEDNFRPVQDLNTRTVSYSTPDPSHGSVIAPSLIVSIFSFFLFSAMK